MRGTPNIARSLKIVALLSGKCTVLREHWSMQSPSETASDPHSEVLCNRVRCTASAPIPQGGAKQHAVGWIDRWCVQRKFHQTVICNLASDPELVKS